MLAPDTRLKERYRILHKIGGGGFGYVYKAIDEVFGCSVAIKETREEVANLDKLRKAFEREAKLLRNLKHASLPRVTDYFFHGEAQFLVMDFIEGEDLAARLKKRLQQHQGPFTCQELLPWADKILAALEYLHSRPEPIVHRDIKPSNIKLTDEGEVYLLDFGLAKGVTGQMSTIIEGQTTSGLVGFTREYAPLEQLQGEATEPHSDIYAFGSTLYHLLTGRLPVSASQRDEAIQRGQSDPLRPAHEVNPAIPLNVSRLISRALAVRWWDRVGSAAEMRAALERACREATPARTGAANQSAAPTVSPDAGDKFSTLPLPRPGEPAAPDNSQPRDKSPARVRRTSRPWLVAGLALALLTSLAFAARLVFPGRFAPAASPESDTQKTHSPEAPTPLKVATPSDLTLRRTLEEHKDIVWSVAFSPDGSLAASAGEDKTIILWDTKTWSRKFPPLTGHTGAVYSVAFSPDGKTLASGSHDTTVRLWDTQTGQFIDALREDSKQPVLRLAFSPDGDFLASSSGAPVKGGEEIKLWDVRNGWLPTPLKAPANKVFAIAFSPDGRTLAGAGLGNTLHLWNVGSKTRGEDLRIDQPRDALITSLAFSADGKYMACGSSDTTIKLWLFQSQTRRWEEVKPLEAHKLLEPNKSFIISIAFSPDNRTLVSSSKDGTVRSWDVAARTSKLLSNPGGSLTPQRSMAFTPDGQALMTGGEDHAVRIWQ